MKYEQYSLSSLRVQTAIALNISGDREANEQFGYWTIFQRSPGADPIRSDQIRPAGYRYSADPSIWSRAFQLARTNSSTQYTVTILYCCIKYGNCVSIEACCSIASPLFLPSLVFVFESVVRFGSDFRTFFITAEYPVRQQWTPSARRCSPWSSRRTTRSTSAAYPLSHSWHPFSVQSLLPSQTTIFSSIHFSSIRTR